RAELQHAIELAPENAKNDALAAMAISFAFESKADEAARYYQRIYDAQMQANDPAAAAATANALGRVFLESGRLDKAEQWYRTGYETSQRLSQRPRSQLTLWDLRWEHALGRIAARRHRTPAADIVEERGHPGALRPPRRARRMADAAQHQPGSRCVEHRRLALDGEHRQDGDEGKQREAGQRRVCCRRPPHRRAQHQQ